MPNEDEHFVVNFAGGEDFWVRVITAARKAAKGQSWTIPMPLAADVDGQPVQQVNIVFHAVDYPDPRAFAIWMGQECPYPLWAELIDTDA